MTPRQRFLLEQLASEAVEVAHITLKAAQFGPDEIMPGQPLTNMQRVLGELTDLAAASDMLRREGLLPVPDPAEFEAAVQAKRAKVERYMAFALDGEPHPMKQPLGVGGEK
jgi:hypothetical protein